MFVTSHVGCGAIIGRALRGRPGRAFVAGVVSHFVMDACPHWGITTESHDGEARFLKIARRDGLVALAAMGLGAVLAPRDARAAVIAAMAGAAIVDLDKPCEHFFGRNPFPSPIQWFHAAIQHEAAHRLPAEMAVAAGLAAINAAFAVLDRHD